MQTGKTLSIYVDESGNFGDILDSARYCMVALVLQDETVNAGPCVKEYYQGLYNTGADPESMSFHTAPLIRQEDQFSAMSRHMRGKIFYQMLSFVRKCEVRFKCIWLDTKFVASELQVESNLRRQLAGFIQTHPEEFTALKSVQLYYDAGQKVVTRILDALVENLPCPVSVIQGALQKDHLLLQVADFLCTIKLIECRINSGIPFNSSEKKFFGSPRDFKRNVLRKVKGKELV